MWRYLLAAAVVFGGGISVVTWLSGPSSTYHDFAVWIVILFAVAIAMYPLRSNALCSFVFVACITVGIIMTALMSMAPKTP